MAFTGAEKVTIAEITQELKSYSDILALAVDSDTETLIKADIVTWNLNRDKVKVEMKGGSDGIDFRVVRLLNTIRMRVRKLLGLSLVSDEVLALDPNALQLFELEVGSNFDSSV